MDLSGILGKLLPIMPLAAAGALIIIGLAAGTYIYYRRSGGMRIVTAGQFAAGFLLLGWFAVVLMLTTFSRGANFEGWFNFDLFSGYVSAWHQWSLFEWQLILFNMLMFAPLGFLLPLLSARTRRFVTVLLLSLLVTTGIEAVQAVTRRGIFELDDLLHNTLGSLAGFFLVSGILEMIERRKAAVRPIFRALAIPLVFAALYTGAMIVYHTQEFGNLSIRPAMKQHMAGVELTLQTELAAVAEPVSLYASDRIHNRAYGEEIASLLTRSFGLRQEGGVRIENANRIWQMRDENGETYSLTYMVASGEWSFLSEGYGGVGGPFEPAVMDDHRAYFEPWLLESGLLPPNAAFRVQYDEVLRWELLRSSADIARGEEDYMSGFMLLTPAEDGLAPNELNYYMQANRFVRKTAIISPAEAYEAIEQGDFAIYNGLKRGDRLQVSSCELDYVYDSKGYYQPVYRFSGTLNGSSWDALVPAIR